MFGRWPSGAPLALTPDHDDEALGADASRNNNFGYIMDHGVGPNGGGVKVNQYTIIYDMYYSSGTLPFFNCENTNNAPATVDFAGTRTGVLSHKSYSGKIDLAPFGVELLQEK